MYPCLQRNNIASLISMSRIRNFLLFLSKLHKG